MRLLLNKRSTLFWQACANTTPVGVKFHDVSMFHVSIVAIIRLVRYVIVVDYSETKRMMDKMEIE